jgi:hypothetical protein
MTHSKYAVLWRKQDGGAGGGGADGSKGTRITVISWQHLYEVEALSVLTLDGNTQRRHVLRHFVPKEYQIDRTVVGSWSCPGYKEE